VSHSGGSIKYTQVAISAYDAHRETADHKRRHLRLVRDLCPQSSPPPESYAHLPLVLAYFRDLSRDNAKFAEALHKAFYVFNMMERQFSIGDNSSWHSRNNAVSSMAADRAVLLGKRYVGKMLLWEGAMAWEVARLHAAELSASIAERQDRVEGKDERLEDTLAEDTVFVQSLSAARRVRLAALVRAQAAKDAATYAAVLVEEAAVFEQSFDQDDLLTVPSMNALYPLPVEAEERVVCVASVSHDADEHARGVKRQHDVDEMKD
jgi:hypothetical protein